MTLWPHAILETITLIEKEKLITVLLLLLIILHVILKALSPFLSQEPYAASLSFRLRARCLATNWDPSSSISKMN